MLALSSAHGQTLSVDASVLSDDEILAFAFTQARQCNRLAAADPTAAQTCALRFHCRALEILIKRGSRLVVKEASLPKKCPID